MDVEKRGPRPLDLPAGTLLRPLEMHHDLRGAFTEVFRQSWDAGIAPVQWNVVRSEKGVLRGVHVHLRHDDYLVVLHGRATVGLRDLRPHSPTSGKTALIQMRGEELEALTIPPGVAHGFYFHEASTHLYAVSEYWDRSDELGCQWADPELEIAWPEKPTTLSEHDRAAPPLSVLLRQLEHQRGTAAPARPMAHAEYARVSVP